MVCTVIAALFGMPGGVLLFIPLYHPLHDVYHIHSEVTVFFLFAIFLSVIWLSFPRTSDAVTNHVKKTTNSVMLLFLAFYYGFFIGKS